MNEENLLAAQPKIKAKLTLRGTVIGSAASSD
jgi:hypothetical protein